MKVFSEKTHPYLQDTSVENLFISEYMVPANGDYVKVYLLTKMCLKTGDAISNRMLAKTLKLSLQEVLDAWNYWESKHVIRKHYSGPDPQEFDIEFLSMKKAMFAAESASSDEEVTEDPQETVSLLNSTVYSSPVLALISEVETLTGRMLSAKEQRDLQMWLEDWGMSRKVIQRAYQLSMKERRKAPEHSYISTIIRSWYENGLFQEEALEQYLENHDRKHHSYRRIFQALGFIGRFPTEEEKRIMDIWLDDYMMDMNTILEACKKTAGTSRPSINYIHAILTDWKENQRSGVDQGKRFSMGEIEQIYHRIREENQEISDNRRKEVYASIPRIQEIDGEIKILRPQLLQMGMGREKNSSSFQTMIREQKNLQIEKRNLLKRAGYPEDYLKPVYTCQECKDTGFLDSGEKCVCLVNRLIGQA